MQPNSKVTITVTFRKTAGVSNCPRDDICPMAAFADADRSAWYHDGVHYCVENGLMEGTGPDTFAPRCYHHPGHDRYYPLAAGGQPDCG